jgi:hypothetical protein
MLKVAVGHSNDPDSQSAIAEILAQCAETLAGETPKAGILISAIDFDHALILESIHETYPNIQLIGGTSVGEMSSVLGFQEDSVTLMVFASDTIEMRAGVGRNLSHNAIVATQEAVTEASEALTQSVKLCLTIAEGLGCDAAALLDGLTQQVGIAVPIYGGLAGDDWQFKTTYQFFGTEVLTDSVPVLLLAGELLVSCGVATGQSPIGEQGIVTKSNGSTVYEIDGRPALDFYRDYFGDMPVAWGASLGGSVAVCELNASQFYLRSPSGDDPAARSVSYFGSVPEQASIQLTKTGESQILSAVDESLQLATAGYPGKTPAAAFIVSCASRLKNLGTRAKEEQEAVKDHLGMTVPSIGLYAYGEIGPFQVQQPSYFHNETFLTLLIGTH